MLIRTALFAALTAVGGFIRIPLGVSSITLQFLFTAMAGILLGPMYGAISQTLYVTLGLLGMPFFATGGGLLYFLQPTFGFLLGFIPAAAVIGFFTKDNGTRQRMVLGCAVGLLVMYVVGVPYMALILNGYLGREVSIQNLLWAALLPFLPGDAVKIAVCTAVCPVLRKRLFPIKKN